MENIEQKLEKNWEKFVNTGEFPIRDGIINYEKYNNSPVKILLILKEGNVDENDKQKNRDLRNEIFEDGHLENALNIPTFRKIIYSVYQIYHPETEWSEIPFANENEAYDVLKSIAYININKLPGSNISSDEEIETIFIKNKDALLEQIQLINPEVIICGNTLKYMRDALMEIGWNTTIENKEFIDDNTDAYITKGKGVIINAWHPAYWKISDKNYTKGIFDAYKFYQTIK